MKGPISVLLVDDHHIVLHGLSAFLESQEDIVVAGKAMNAEDALSSLANKEPAVALLDVRLPDMDGITLCREIRARHPAVSCLMLSSFADREAMLEALIAGASGYILKDASLPEVVLGIRRVAAGESLMDPALTSEVLGRLRRSGQDEKAPPLTPQEERILDLITEGLSNREIGERLNLAEQTVKNYVSSVLSKLGLQRRTQAVVYQKDRANKATQGR